MYISLPLCLTHLFLSIFIRIYIYIFSHSLLTLTQRFDYIPCFFRNLFVPYSPSVRFSFFPSFFFFTYIFVCSFEHLHRGKRFLFKFSFFSRALFSSVSSVQPNICMFCYKILLLFFLNVYMRGWMCLCAHERISAKPCSWQHGGYREREVYLSFTPSLK